MVAPHAVGPVLRMTPARPDLTPAEWLARQRAAIQWHEATVKALEAEIYAHTAALRRIVADIRDAIPVPRQ